MAIDLDTTVVGQPTPVNPVTDADQELLREISLGHKIVVDGPLWHRFIYLLMTHPEQLVGGYTPQARVIMLGKLRGGQTLNECQAFWEESKTQHAASQ